MPNKKSFSFSYKEKLHLQKDFNKVFKKGRRLDNKIIKIYAYKKASAPNGAVSGSPYLRRLGLVSPKKVGTAVQRNKTKRILREIFRTNKHSLEPGLDLIFISKPETASQDYNSLKTTILEMLKSAGFYK
ncbi:ribonuclease P protein component [Endomicrobium proavitum]|uniref:Ribonuclease P protein component n=1 Tax=Endomicrobium proavitum TaxID=1408281 RepID=A0A0G3WKW5_9BACT|nr:ribonuclease P protein component [Endomicrobium proavitum]AKL98492.1 Ribonuclease P protein component [Endomicrobium proavitum]